jgi:hypothetical protein
MLVCRNDSRDNFKDCNRMVLLEIEIDSFTLSYMSLV